MRADPAGNIELSLGHVIPQSQAVLAFTLVMTQASKMRHARHQIDKSNRVADGGVLFGKRLMRLAIGFVLDHPRRAVRVPVRCPAPFLIFDIVEMRLRAARVDKIFHKGQVTRFLSDVVKPHKRQLNFRMARITVKLLLAGAKDPVDMVRQFAYHIQQTAFSGPLKIGHASFNHMSGAVQFVAFGKVRPALTGCFHREVGVEIAIVTLRRRNQLNYLIGGFFAFRVGLLAQRPRDGFQPFRHVAVLKHHSIELPLFQPCRNAEVGDGVTRFGFDNAIV
ncbi:Uncharacterised protein [Enterobacter ludwigii]|nr:Uncharacterised protein [Enterobacter ludwigii]